MKKNKIFLVSMALALTLTTGLSLSAAAASSENIDNFQSNYSRSADISVNGRTATAGAQFEFGDTWHGDSVRTYASGVGIDHIFVKAEWTSHGSSHRAEEQWGAQSASVECKGKLSFGTGKTYHEATAYSGGYDNAHIWRGYR